MLHDWKYASKRSEFLGFYCYLCHVCYGFLCLWIRNTKISENSDMAKSWATFCCPGTYKNNYQSCCGIKGYLEEERNEQIRKENERRFQQEQQRINNQRLHEINERNRIALERENARRRAEEKRKAEQKRKETSRTNTNVPPSQPKNNRWSIGSNPTLLPRATSSKTATTKTNSSNKTDGKEGK